MQSWLSPGLQSPCPVHEPKVPQAQELLHVRLWVPQLPQGCEETCPGAQTPSPWHVLQGSH